jgi:hypothetical protein
VTISSSIAPALKPQRLRLLDLRQRLHLAQHIGRHLAVDLDQRVGARRITADMRYRLVM